MSTTLTAPAGRAAQRPEDRMRPLVLSSVLALLLAAAALLPVVGSTHVALAGKPSYACSLTGSDGTPYSGVTFASRKEAAAWEAAFEAGGYFIVECWRVHT